MKITLISAGLCIGLLSTCSSATPILKTKYLGIGVENGAITSLKAIASGTDYLAAGQPSPILQVRVAGKFHSPDDMDWDAKTERMTLRFSKADAEVVVAAKTKPTHVTLTVLSVTPVSRIRCLQKFAFFMVLFGELVFWQWEKCFFTLCPLQCAFFSVFSMFSFFSGAVAFNNCFPCAPALSEGTVVQDCQMWQHEESK